MLFLYIWYGNIFNSAFTVWPDGMCGCFRHLQGSTFRDCRFWYTMTFHGIYIPTLELTYTSNGGSRLSLLSFVKEIHTLPTVAVKWFAGVSISSFCESGPWSLKTVAFKPSIESKLCSSCFELVSWKQQLVFVLSGVLCGINFHCRNIFSFFLLAFTVQQLLASKRTNEVVLWMIIRGLICSRNIHSHWYIYHLQLPKYAKNVCKLFCWLCVISRRFM